MNIKIIATGKIKEQYLKDALKEYEKRLTPFCSFSILEIQAEQINDDFLNEKYKELEADRILQNIKKESYIITLEINGKSFSSMDFAKKLKDISNEGINEIVFIIGGANGLHKKISDISNLKLSFSKMTFTNQLIRLILTEQIYRAFKINANEPYHR
ncbi:MAG: 23S rRNA (pseudouridine(1915)-N(3))-methyltransferase RlmH [Candidatus Gastranaerophilales bacterium]|nr:23S rRNA (pseudouridine(1915)-N(3))-methyltransferase RlmH [Candidatus Gastranaerophilales bacterium]